MNTCTVEPRKNRALAHDWNSFLKVWVEEHVVTAEQRKHGKIFTVANQIPWRKSFRK